jgi:hypothetical protein
MSRLGGFYLVKNTPFGLRSDHQSYNILGIIGERARRLFLFDLFDLFDLT